jgi:hypothetical protein
MKRVGELRQQAERYQRLKRQISDPAVLQAIGELAGEGGRPEGCDVENWLAAERGLAALGQHTQRIRDVQPSSGPPLPASGRQLTS